MRALLDTHVFLWLVATPARVGSAVEVLSRDSTELLLSAASSWEIALKHQLGKLPLPDRPDRYVPEAARRTGVRLVAVEHADALGVADLPQHHRDPFDHLLLAATRRLDAVLVTADAAMDAYDVPMLRV